MPVIKCGEVWTLDVPPGIQEYLSEIGGRNIYGDPIFRVAWCNSMVKETRLGWPSIFAGVTERPRRKKYARQQVHDRFVVEKWLPPEAYGSPEDWEESGWSANSGKIDYGPYPSRGVYSLVDVVEGVDKHGANCFIWPTRAYVKAVVTASNVRSMISPREEMYLQEQREEREEESRFNRRLDMIKEANKPSNYYDSWVSYNIPGK